MSVSEQTTPPPAKPVSDRVRALMEAVEAERLARKRKEAELTRKEAEMKKVKMDATLLQARIEEEEEFIANNLLRRLETAKQEKANLVLQVANEEDFLKNTLQKRLERVRQEKVQLEMHLEMEQEYIVNKLQKQLTEVIRQKNALQAKLGEGHSGLISKLEQSLDQYKESLQPQAEETQRQSILHLETQIRSMQEQQSKLDSEADGYRLQCNSLEKRLEEVKQDHFIMQAKAHRFREKLQQLQLQREAELLQSELSQERCFNHRVRKSQDGKLAAWRSRSASELARRSPNTKKQKELESSRLRSQSVNVLPRTVLRPGARPRPSSVTVTPPMESPRAGDMFPRASSRTELRSHTAELLQMSPCIAHHSPHGAGRYLPPMARLPSTSR